jgi:hypothetical protein
MIGMVEVFITIEPSFRVAGQDGVRPIFAYEAGEILSQRNRRFQLPIRIAQKNRLLDAEDRVGCELFLLPQLSQFLFVAAILCRIVRAGVAAGDDHRDDFTAGTRPTGKRPADTELLIVRMCINAHCTLGDISVVTHKVDSLLCIIEY